MTDHVREMKLAFPGQNVVSVEYHSTHGPHISVPNTVANVKLLKTRGYMFEQGVAVLRVYFPNESLMND